ncbi:DUF3141 domain-containing protein [Xanthobacter sp. TB0139]|uniref:DUF3141 domain-containing protein n=1 Tax=Xanthobacter sp. TB0139 TaxID=3459178 RepID=UPI0040396665
MTGTTAQAHEGSATPPSNIALAAVEYAVDAWQRAILYADVRRQRGDQYQAHMAETVPNVLNFPAELVMDGRNLPRPVNYGLVRIPAPEDTPTDPAKRPFVIVDPRAGHGPGIGGFKPDSEIGAALKAGHPCYFIGFTPYPQPGQTIEDVMHAEAAFLEKVIALHPDAGKPAVIGNCQAGWQILMTAAMRPELFGPIIVAGSPLSYWAGWPGKNPMRYSGGVLGGSWMTALAGDLGHGLFDGASLVQNFENLDPANTLWKKNYNLYANIDTEAPRYLGFEKYWGGHVFLNAQEMQYIVDNLFVGNRLSSGEIVTSDGVRLDLRNIRSPIVVFCSRGDNITPPPQALGWITDLYQSDEELLGHNQTIVYAMHDSIGHLGIFVSGAVGRKEHRKFASNIELINLMPAGVYQAVIAEQDAGPHAPEDDAYLMTIERRRLEDVRQVVQPDPKSDRRFAAVARLSEINLSLYRNFMQPWVRLMATSQSAEMLQKLHPLRISYELWSGRNLMAPAVARAAEQVQAHRQPAPSDNLFLKMQNDASELIITALDNWRDLRDAACERWFEMFYGSPLISALAGLDARPGMDVRPHLGVAPEYRAMLNTELETLRGEVNEGGLLEAGLRALGYVGKDHPGLNERQYNLAIELRPGLRTLPAEQFRRIVRRQAGLMLLEPEATMAALPLLLSRAAPQDIRTTAQVLEQVRNLGAPPTQEEQNRLKEMLDLFETAAQAQESGKAPQNSPESHLKLV